MKTIFLAAFILALIAGVTTTTTQAHAVLHGTCDSAGNCKDEGTINGATINGVPQKGGGQVDFGPGGSVQKCVGSADFKASECSPG